MSKLKNISHERQKIIIQHDEELHSQRGLKLKPPSSRPDSNRGQLRIRRKAGSNQWARDFLIKATEAIRSFLNAISFLFLFHSTAAAVAAVCAFPIFFFPLHLLSPRCMWARARSLFCCFKATFWLLALVKVALPSTALAPCGLRRHHRSLTRVQFNVSPKLKRGRETRERESRSREAHFSDCNLQRTT